MRYPLKSMVYDDGSLEIFGSGVVRKNYNRHHPRIATIADLKATLRAGKYTGVGGYPLYLICADGEAVSFDGARKNFRELCWAFTGKWSRNNGSRVIACEVNYEDADLFCVYTGEKIDAAYE